MISRYFSCVAVLIALIHTTWVIAQNSVYTQSVKGRAPVASNVSIGTSVPPMVGDTLIGNYTFTDGDHDNEQGTLLQWYQDAGLTAIASGQTYTLQENDAGHSLSLGVTPTTDSVRTDPWIGLEVRSNPTSVITGFPISSSTLVIDKSTIYSTGTDTATVTLTLKDRNANPVSGCASRLALGYTVNTGLLGANSVSITNAKEVSDGSGIYKFSIIAISTGTLTLTPALNGALLSTTPTTVPLTITIAPSGPLIASLESISDKRIYSYATTTSISPYPGTGFKGASFKINLRADLDPENYNWVMTMPVGKESATAVSPSGVVTFNSYVGTGVQTVTATHKDTGDQIIYKYTVKMWFLPGVTTQGTHTQALSGCTNAGGSLPYADQLINQGLYAQRYADTSVPTLYGDWGSVIKYPGNTLSNTSETQTKSAITGYDHRNISLIPVDPVGDYNRDTYTSAYFCVK